MKKHKQRNWLLIPLFAMVVLVLFQARPVEAKKLELADSTDVIQRISGGKGKVVIVNFWASWCPPCREEMPDLKKVRDAFSQDELYLLGVSVDQNASAAEDAVDEFDLNYDVVLAEPDVYETFGIQSIPRLLIYDVNGKLVIDHTGVVTFEDLHKFIEEMLQGK